MIATWQFIIDGLSQNLKVALLYVVESNGSSPGRNGFMMAVDENENFIGTIGGGIMEVKLIELAKMLILKEDFKAQIIDQYHDKNQAKRQSGLICSGNQKIVITKLDQKDLPIIKQICNETNSRNIELSNRGIKFTKAETSTKIESTEVFSIVRSIKPKKRIHIFGAGHVGVALAKQMQLLNFDINIYDNRPEIKSLNQDKINCEINIIDYAEIKNNIHFDENDYVVIVSFGYRYDKLIFSQIYNLKFAYIGMMGSDAKIETLKKEYIAEGINQDMLAHVHMPIGINILSKTAEEIAVSIAGQIILESNKHLPTGRKYTL